MLTKHEKVKLIYSRQRNVAVNVGKKDLRKFKRFLIILAEGAGWHRIIRTLFQTLTQNGSCDIPPPTPIHLNHYHHYPRTCKTCKDTVGNFKDVCSSR